MMIRPIAAKIHDYQAFLQKEQRAWLLPHSQQALRALATSLGYEQVFIRKATEAEDRSGIDCFIMPTQSVEAPISVQIKYIFHPSGNYPLELSCDTPNIIPWALDRQNPSAFILFVNMNNGEWIGVKTQHLVDICHRMGLTMVMTWGQVGIRNQLNGVFWTNYITLLKRKQMTWLLEHNQAEFYCS